MFVVNPTTGTQTSATTSASLSASTTTDAPNDNRNVAMKSNWNGLIDFGNGNCINLNSAMGTSNMDCNQPTSISNASNPNQTLRQSIDPLPIQYGAVQIVDRVRLEDTFQADGSSNMNSNKNNSNSGHQQPMAATTMTATTSNGAAYCNTSNRNDEKCDGATQIATNATARNNEGNRNSDSNNTMPLLEMQALMAMLFQQSQNNVGVANNRSDITRLAEHDGTDFSMDFSSSFPRTANDRSSTDDILVGLEDSIQRIFASGNSATTPVNAGTENATTDCIGVDQHHQQHHESHQVSPPYASSLGASAPAPWDPVASSSALAQASATASSSTCLPRAPPSPAKSGGVMDDLSAWLSSVMETQVQPPSTPNAYTQPLPEHQDINMWLQQQMSALTAAAASAQPSASSDNTIARSSSSATATDTAPASVSAPSVSPSSTSTGRPAVAYDQVYPMQKHRQQRYDMQNVQSKTTTNSTSNSISNSKSTGKMPLKFRQYQADQWEARYQELVIHKRCHGHCLVDQNVNRRLSHWVKRQRCQMKLKRDGSHTTLTDERESKLAALDFVWDSHAVAWEHRFNDLMKYMKRHGHVNVLTVCDENPSLGIWVKGQRRQYRLHLNGQRSTLTVDRIRRLNKVGFKWTSPSSANRVTTHHPSSSSSSSSSSPTSSSAMSSLPRLAFPSSSSSSWTNDSFDRRCDELTQVFED